MFSEIKEKILTSMRIAFQQ